MSDRSRRLGLLGGTFDPIHIGHLIMAIRAAESLDLDQVLFLPAQVPPHKLGEDIASIDDRVAMVRLAIAENPRFGFSDLDLQSDAPSYTSELLARVQEQRPDAELWFIAGADSLRDFATWHEPQSVLHFARLAIASRPGVVITADILERVPGLRQRVDFFESPLIDISSTDIRQRSRANLEIKYMVPDSVERYIATYRVYDDRG